MSFKKNKYTDETVIMIKRSIDVDEELKNFIFMNSNYRRKVWNDFVEEYYRCKESGEKFNPMKFKCKYFNEIEKPNHIYETYTTGISEQVMKDIINALIICNLNNGTLKFRKFNRFLCSFKVHCKGYYEKLAIPYLPKFNSRVNIDDSSQISFRTFKTNRIFIKLREPLWRDACPVGDKMYYFDKEISEAKYAFSEEDIKEISFIHELGKFYICLSVRIIRLYDRKSEKTKRKESAGIDLGIHNPICISDKDGNYILRMSQKELNRIHYLERRTKRLQHIMDKKFLENKKRGINPYSKNYIKVQKKFRITWYKIRNIRLNWRRKIAKLIATRYKKVCVDNFSTPGKEEHIGIPVPLCKKINSYNRMHGMYDCSRLIEHACNMYKTKYIESPEDTTRTCSCCGHVNPHLSLSQRVFVCEECNYTVDRDVNASQNCYAFIV